MQPVRALLRRLQAAECSRNRLKLQEPWNASAKKSILADSGPATQQARILPVIAVLFVKSAKKFSIDLAHTSNMTSVCGALLKLLQVHLVSSTSSSPAFISLYSKKTAFSILKCQYSQYPSCEDVSKQTDPRLKICSCGEENLPSMFETNSQLLV